MRKARGERLLGIDFQKKESRTKQELYKKAINRCCMPNCIYGFGLETHHIQPLSKKGKDEFNNYIVLCKVCHRKSKLHSGWRLKQLELFTFKFYIEQEVFGIGITSDDYSDEEFQKLLRNHIYSFNNEVRTIKEEDGEE